MTVGFVVHALRSWTRGGINNTTLVDYIDQVAKRGRLLVRQMCVVPRSLSSSHSKSLLLMIAIRGAARDRVVFHS